MIECSGRNAFLSGVFILVVLVIEVWVFSLETNQRIKALRAHIFVITGAVLFACSRYIWKRMSILLPRADRFWICSWTLRVFLALSLLLGQLSMILGALLVSKEPSYVNVASGYFLGIIVFLTFSFVLVDLGLLLGRQVIPKSFRVHVTQAGFLLALVLTLSGIWYVSQVEVKHVTLPVKGLHPRLNGTTVVQLSDIHLGPFNGKSALNELVGRVNGLKPDLVLITGDLVDSTVSNLQEAVTPLRDIKSKHGVYFSTGNHEYYTGDVDSWIEELPRHGVTPLVNQRVCLFGEEKQGCSGGLYLAGLEDIETRRINYGSHSMDLHSALSGRGEGVPTIVMAHQPWAAVEAIMWKDVRLVLSGHTHAGQVLPIMFLVYVYNPYFVGLYEPRPSVYVYVNPGSVYYIMPYRHFFRPEITLFTLICAV